MGMKNFVKIMMKHQRKKLQSIQNNGKSVSNCVSNFQLSLIQVWSVFGRLRVVTVRFKVIE